MFQDHALVKQGLKYYTRGLCQLQKALRNFSLAREDKALAAYMVLRPYGVLDSPIYTP